VRSQERLSATASFSITKANPDTLGLNRAGFNWLKGVHNFQRAYSSTAGTDQYFRACIHPWAAGRAVQRNGAAGDSQPAVPANEYELALALDRHASIWHQVQAPICICVTTYLNSQRTRHRLSRGLPLQHCRLKGVQFFTLTIARQFLLFFNFLSKC
jgi:hypothetical protein